MIQHISYFILLLFLPFPFNGQNSKLPTLTTNSYNTTSQLIEEADKLLNDNPVKAAELLRIVIQQATGESNDTILAKASLLYAQVCYAINESENEISYAIKACELYSKLNDKKGLSAALVRLSRAKLNSGQFTNVLDYLKQAKELAYESGDSALIGNVLSHLGSTYNWIRWDHSIQSETEKKRRFLQFSDSAVYYLKRCIDIQTKIKHKALGITYNNLGIALYDKAIATDKDFSKALVAHQMAMRIMQAQGNKKGIASSYQETGKIYFQQGEHAKGIDLIKQSIIIADSINYTPQLEDSYKDLKEFYLVIGEKDSVIKYQQLHFNVLKKRIEHKISVHLAEMESKFNLSQKETELLLKNKEIESHQITLSYYKRLTAFVLTALSIITLLAIFYYRLYKKNKTLSQKNAILLREQNHRVKNNLQVISALLSLQANRISNLDARKAIEDSQLRIQTMAMINKKLYGDNITNIEVVPFIKELMDNIIPVFGWNIDGIEKEISSDIETLNVDKIVPIGLIINELLTNSCKYAFPNVEKPRLTLKINKIGNVDCCLHYYENGPGFNYKQAREKNSFGLKLIELQSRQILGDYQWKNENGTYFYLRFSN